MCDVPVDDSDDAAMVSVAPAKVVVSPVAATVTAGPLIDESSSTGVPPTAARARGGKGKEGGGVTAARFSRDAGRAPRPARNYSLVMKAVTLGPSALWRDASAADSVRAHMHEHRDRS